MCVKPGKCIGPTYGSQGFPVPTDKAHEIKEHNNHGCNHEGVVTGLVALKVSLTVAGGEEAVRDLCFGGITKGQGSGSQQSTIMVNRIPNVVREVVSIRIVRGSERQSTAAIPLRLEGQ